MIQLTCRDPGKIYHFENCMRVGVIYSECGYAYTVADMLCLDRGEMNMRGGYSKPPIWQVTLVEVDHCAP